jgi:hypothetical protein
LTTFRHPAFPKELDPAGIAFQMIIKDEWPGFPEFVVPFSGCLIIDCRNQELDDRSIVVQNGRRSEFIANIEYC